MTRAPGLRRPGRPWHVTGALIAGLVVLALVVPGLLGLDGVTPFAQAVALRGPVSLALVALAVLLVVLPGRRVTWPAAAVLLAGAAVGTGVLLERGTSGVLGTDAPAVAHPTALVVLVLNTQGSAPPDDVARLVVERQADVVVLPETRSRDAARVAAASAAAGLRFQVLADDGLGRSATGATALLVAEGLGRYEVTGRQGGTLAGFTATGRGPAISAVHPLPPLPGSTAAWHEEGAVAVATCESTPGAIVAGDFNTTPDHPAFTGLDRCVLATVEGDAGGVGTWPAALPRALGAPIDHVLVDAGAWRVVRAAVLEPPPGTDHRAVEVVLRSR